MKKIIAATLVTLAIGFAGLSAAQEVKAPKISAKEVKYDFGKVVQGTQATHVFEISNTGNDTLVIEQVQTS
jgi:uncharacterized protein DUF1573